MVDVLKKSKMADANIDNVYFAITCPFCGNSMRGSTMFYGSGLVIRTENVWWDRRPQVALKYQVLPFSVTFRLAIAEVDE